MRLSHGRVSGEHRQPESRGGRSPAGLGGLVMCLLSGLIVPWSCTHLPGRPRAVSAREGSGALSAGQAGKMEARWHELVGTLERAQVA